MERGNGRCAKGASTLLFPSDYVVIDIETTGLSPYSDAIIELSALKVEGYSVTSSFSSLVNPLFRISPFITQLTGITNGMLLSALPIESVLPRFLDYVGSSHIVGHNVNFDINFIYDNSVRLFASPFSNDFTDTMRLSRAVLGTLPHHRLSDLSAYYGVSYEGAHRALQDCRITHECFLRLRDDITSSYGCIEKFQESRRR